MKKVTVTDLPLPVSMLWKTRITDARNKPMFLIKLILEVLKTALPKGKVSMI